MLRLTRSCFALMLAFSVSLSGQSSWKSGYILDNSGTETSVEIQERN